MNRCMCSKIDSKHIGGILGASHGTAATTNEQAEEEAFANLSDNTSSIITRTNET